MAGAAWLRLHDISTKSFWIDEGASVAIARMDWFNFARLLWPRAFWPLPLLPYVARGPRRAAVDDDTAPPPRSTGAATRAHRTVRAVSH